LWIEDCGLGIVDWKRLVIVDWGLVRTALIVAITWDVLLPVDESHRRFRISSSGSDPLRGNLIDPSKILWCNPD
jgi:hypothetical protein